MKKMKNAAAVPMQSAQSTVKISQASEEKNQNVPIGNVSFNASRQKSENSMSVAKPAKRKEINLSELKKALNESLEKKEEEEPKKIKEEPIKVKEDKKRDDLEDKNKGIIQPGQKIEF